MVEVAEREAEGAFDEAELDEAGESWFPLAQVVFFPEVRHQFLLFRTLPTATMPTQTAASNAPVRRTSMTGLDASLSTMSLASGRSTLLKYALSVTKRKTMVVQPFFFTFEITCALSRPPQCHHRNGRNT